jgi:hypothetical protein
MEQPNNKSQSSIHEQLQTILCIFLHVFSSLFATWVVFMLPRRLALATALEF